MTPTNTTPQLTATTPAFDDLRSKAVRISISGGDLLLKGRFDHWLPVSVEGADPAQGSAQIFVDVTGLAPAAGEDTGDMFAFTAQKVRRVGPLAYVAKGTMSRGDVERPAEAVIQSPAPHTPFVVMTFTVDRTRLGDVWDDLSMLVGNKVDTSQLFPRAWWRAPVVAEA